LSLVTQASEIVWPEVTRHVAYILRTWFESDKAQAEGRDGLITSQRSSAQTRECDRLESDYRSQLSAMLPRREWLVLASMLDSARPTSRDLPFQKTRHLRTTPGQATQAMALIDNLRRQAARLDDAAASAPAEAAATAEAAQNEAGRGVGPVQLLADLTTEAHTALTVDWFSADTWWDNLWVDQKLAFTRRHLADARRAIARKWLQGLNSNLALDDEQVDAIVATGPQIRVTARAGAGKTRVLVLRAAFLHLHLNVPVDQILIVAFNRKAVAEIRERLRGYIKQGPLPHVLTFHALAYALTRAADSDTAEMERLLFDDADRDAFDLSREIQTIIDRYLMTPVHLAAVRAAMMTYFEADWHRLVKHGRAMTPEQFNAVSNNLTSETLNGESVRSSGEKLIANTLFRHSVPYVYEKRHRVEKLTLTPDFTIRGIRNGRTQDVAIIEYYGMTGNAAYDDGTRAKRDAYAKQRRLPVLEYYTLDPDLKDAFTTQLIADLNALEIKTTALTDDQVWERARERGAVDKFSQTAGQIIGRARQHNYTVDQFDALVAAHSAPVEEKQFLDVVAPLYRTYLGQVERREFNDFTGLVWNAVKTLTIEDSTFAYPTDVNERVHADIATIRYVLIDEYQDFSVMFDALTQTVLDTAERATGSKPELFVVGDDWQAINGFAGADQGFLTEFAAAHPEAETLTLLTNHRSGRTIVEAGNLVMAGHGPPATSDPKIERAELRWALTDQLTPTRGEELWLQQHRPAGIRELALLRLLRHALQTPGKVAVLFRIKPIPWGKTRGHLVAADRVAQAMQALFTTEQRERIEMTTIHKYKGRQAATVILADADRDHAPMIHPRSVLTAVFGDTPAKVAGAERRLFYVALTRAMSTVYLMSDSENRTAFLNQGAFLTDGVSVLHWDNYRAPINPRDHYEIRVYDGRGAKGELERLDFWYERGKGWWRRGVPAAAFRVERWREELRSTRGMRVEVLDGTGHIVHRLWGLGNS
jgi:DNA helicase-4